MQRRSRCLRWLISGMTGVMLCLVVACTAPSSQTGGSSRNPSRVAVAPSSSSATKPDFTVIKRNVEKRLDSADFSVDAIRAVLISVNDKTEVSAYRHLAPTDYADVWSVTKSVLSILVGIAIDEGRLRLDEKVAELLPQYVDRMTERTKSVTLRQLLTMTAGVDTGDYVYDIATKDAVGQIIDHGFVGKPGSEFVYSNASAHLVAGILEHAVHRPLLDYAREKLFDPLGIDTRPANQSPDPVAFRRPGFAWAADREGVNSGCCQLKLTAPDLIEIGRLYLHKGRWQGHQLVSAKWVEQSTVDQLTGEKSEFTGSDGYGYFWWVGAIDKHRYFAAQGSFGQNIIVVPDHRLVVVTVGDEAGLDQPSPAFFAMLVDDILLPIVHS